MNKNYIIKVHSVSDLITNSSEQTYVMATENTIKTLNQLINNILSLGGSKLTCDQLFTIELNKKDLEERARRNTEYDAEYYDVRLSAKSKIPGPLGEETERIIENLGSLFFVETVYN